MAGTRINPCVTVLALASTSGTRKYATFTSWGSGPPGRDTDKPIYAKSFINRLHLVLHACVETFDVTIFLRLWVYGVGTKQDLSDEIDGLRNILYILRTTLPRKKSIGARDFVDSCGLAVT